MDIDYQQAFSSLEGHIIDVKFAFVNVKPSLIRIVANIKMSFCILFIVVTLNKYNVVYGQQLSKFMCQDILLRSIWKA